MTTRKAEVSIKLRDYMGVQTSVLWLTSMAGSASIDDTIDALTAMLADMDNATGAVIEGWSLKFIQQPDIGWKVTPEANTEVETNALLQFVMQLGDYRESLIIPALKAAAIVGGRVDLSNDAVAAFVYMATHTFEGIHLTGRSGQAFLDIDTAMLSFRKHRKQLNRRSIVIP